MKSSLIFRTTSLLLLILIIYFNLSLVNKSYNINNIDKISIIRNNTLKISLNYQIELNDNPIMLFKQTEDFYNMLKKINIFLMKKDVITGSAFIIKNGILTVDHVCNEINNLVRKRERNIENILIRNISKNFSKIEKLHFINSYVFKKYIIIKNFDRSKYKKLNNIKFLKKDKDLDLCLIKNPFRKGAFLSISKNKPRYLDVVYNFSYLNGFFVRNILPFNKGNFLGENKNKFYYTLKVKKGSSGSVVFNKNFEIIGIIDSVYSETNISLGSKRSILKKFIKYFNY